MRYSIQEFIIMFLIKVYQVAMSGYVKKKKLTVIHWLKPIFFMAKSDEITTNPGQVGHATEVTFERPAPFCSTVAHKRSNCAAADPL